MEFSPLASPLRRGDEVLDLPSGEYLFPDAYTPVVFAHSTYLCTEGGSDWKYRTALRIGSAWPVFNADSGFVGIDIVEALYVDHRGQTCMRLAGNVFRLAPSIETLLPPKFSTRAEFYAGLGATFQCCQQWLAAVNGGVTARIILTMQGTQSLVFNRIANVSAYPPIEGALLTLETLEALTDSVSYGQLGRHLGWTVSLPDRVTQSFVCEVGDAAVDAVVEYRITSEVEVLSVAGRSDSADSEEVEQFLEDFLLTLSDIDAFPVNIGDAVLSIE